MAPFTNTTPAPRRSLSLVLSGALALCLAMGLGVWHVRGQAHDGHRAAAAVQQPLTAPVAFGAASAADIASLRALAAAAGLPPTDVAGTAAGAASALTAADIASLRALGAVAGLPPDALTLVALR